MTVLIITLGLLAVLGIAMVTPGSLWGGAPDRRGEVQPLRVQPPRRTSHQRRAA